MQEVYSNLSRECVALKKSESEMFEKYVTACQEKTKALFDSKLEFSHLRTKIKLLKEVLTKRNEECNKFVKKKEKVTLLITVRIVYARKQRICLVLCLLI